VATDVGRSIARVAGNDVQLVPATLKTGRELFILVATRLEDCLDHRRSQIHYYSESHARQIGRPEKVGKPNMVLRLVIDPARANHRRVFRILDWTGPLIVNHEVADAMRERGVTGIGFSRVTL
jgi:uncharacterized protein DUF1629